MDDNTKLKMDLLVGSFAEMQQAATDAQNAFEAVRKTLAAEMEAQQIKTHEVQDGGKIYRATFLQATTPIIDEVGLEKELGTETYEKFTKRVLDRKALEEGMEHGEVDPFAVGKHVTERKNRPSVRFSTRAADDS
jgi:hypothetical protein